MTYLDRNKLSCALAAFSTATLVLTACGGTAEDTEGNGGERVFVESTMDTLPMLNPQFVTSPAVQQVGSGMLEPLVRITDEYELVPWLAQDWAISEDGLQITLYLEEGVEWHDGEPFTSEDVAFNVEELLELDSLGADFVHAIESVSTPDEHTAVLSMHEPYGALMEALALQFILPKHIYEGTDYLENEANQAPVGTGPLVFDLHAEGERVELTANENYWGGQLEFDRVIYPTTTDPNAMDLELLSGELDRRGVTAARLDEIEATPNLETTLRGGLPLQVVLMFNPDTEELANPKVRQLVYAAVDRERIVDVALPDTAEVPNGVFPESLDWARSDEVDFTEDYAYDVDSITQALDEAGYPEGNDGYRFTLDLPYMSHLADVAAVAEVMQSSLAEVGIEVNLVSLDTNVYTDQVYEQRDFDIAVQLATLSTDPSLGITRWYTCNPDRIAARNPSGVCDQGIDSAAQGAILSSTQEDRGAHLADFEEAASQAMIAAPIIFVQQTTAYNTSRWQGHDFASGLTGGNWLDVAPAAD